MPNPPKKKPFPGAEIGGGNRRMTRAVRSDPASYMDKGQWEEYNDLMDRRQEAKRMRTTAASSQVKKKPSAADQLYGSVKKSMNPQVQNMKPSANSILDMLKRLPKKMVQQIYKSLESMDPDQLDMLGKKKYPGE